MLYVIYFEILTLSVLFLRRPFWVPPWDKHRDVNIFEIWRCTSISRAVQDRIGGARSYGLVAHSPHLVAIAVTLGGGEYLVFVHDGHPHYALRFDMLQGCGGFGC